ncbi:hypothetical protein HB687_002551 [Salmonella enterica subsp. diarizonae]|nr:hypothetical protein [Salmonella enterica subsp. diarizonae]EEP6454428.1 hypothetical protein [Salmonella enterica subsp. diarizonae]
MKLYEMEGFLRGKCIPGDLKVNETNAEYLVRKFSEADDRCAALSAKLNMINDLMEAAEQANKLAQEATEKLVQERNALAAENAGLKELIEQHANSVAVCPNCSHEEPSETDDIVALYRSMETPATDVFLAEVRAQGVEMFSEKFGGGTPLSNMVKEVAADFAAKLRKGVAQ